MADKISELLERLKDAQTVESDNRQKCKEAEMFLHTRGGQWEDKISKEWDDRPRYTFDHCNPVVDSIMADMDETDFAIQVLPRGAGATEDMAKNYAGLIRNTENLSTARYIYNQAARAMCSSGLDGWRVKQAYRDDDSFNQDLLVEGINNFKERVWYDPGAVKPTMEDADYCFVLTELTMKEYEKRWPKGSKLGVDQGEYADTYAYKKEGIVIGEYLYRKTRKRTLHLMTDGSVYANDEDFLRVKDELAGRGVTIKQSRERMVHYVCQKFFDGKEYLTDKHETVFEWVPIVPVFANFYVIENKLIYWGAIEHLMDPQRVLNYAESKKVAESALKPLEKVWMTTAQAKPEIVKRSLETQNTNNEPVQLYQHIDGHTPPFKPAPNQPDTVLVEAASSASNYIDKAANLFDAKRGVGLSGQSGETVKLLQNRGSSANFKYIKAMEIALTHTGRILTKAYPKVYDTEQELRIINEDGSPDYFVTGKKVVDEETSEVVKLNDLSVGLYDVICKSGPAYYTKQQETVKTITEVGQVDPTVIQLGGDVLLKSINTPGMDIVAERKRRQLFVQGLIPESQFTDEEKQEVAKAKQQGSQPSPLEQAQLGIAQAEQQKAQTQTLDTLSKIEERQAKHSKEIQQMILDAQLKQQQMMDARDEKMAQMILSQADVLNTHADTLKKIKEAMGVDVAVGPGTAKAYSKQTETVVDTQNQITNNP